MAYPIQNGPAGHHDGRGSALARLAQRLTGSGGFVFSMVVHGMIMIVAGSVVIIRAVAPVEDLPSDGALPGVAAFALPSDIAGENPRTLSEVPQDLSAPVAAPWDPITTLVPPNPAFTPFVPGIGKLPPSTH